MKKCTLIFLMLLFSATTFAQSVGINSDGSTPNPSAMLDVKSTSKGFLAPRMTAEQRGLISSPATGLLVYQTDGETGYYHYNGSAWVTSSSLWSSNLEGAIYYNSGNVGIGTATPGYKLTVQNGEIVSASDTDAGLVFTGTDGTANDMTVRYDRPNARLEFRDNLNSETRMVVKQDGNVGIGTTSPSYKLEIASGDNAAIRLGPNSLGRSLLLGGWNDTDFTEARIQSSNGNLHLDAQGVLGGIYLNHYHSGDVYLVVGGGNVGIGTTNLGSYRLSVNGNVFCNSLTQASDIRFKSDVISIDNGLEKVMQLRPVTFNWKQDEFPDINFDDRNHVGFIAQEVELVVPQVVSTAGDEMQTKSIAYSDLVPVLTKAIQEQQAEIEALKAQNAMLTGKVTELNQLKAEVENLKKSLRLGKQLTDNK